MFWKTVWKTYFRDADCRAALKKEKTSKTSERGAEGK
jgi:hypothetical protein